jgi:hypothetical protein
MEKYLTCRILVEKAEGKRPPERYSFRWNTIKIYFKGIEWQSVEWINPDHIRVKWLHCANILMNIWILHKCGKFFKS